MIINENNKNTILKGIVKRGFNQDPNEIREKLKSTQTSNQEPPKKDLPKPSSLKFSNFQRLK